MHFEVHSWGTHSIQSYKANVTYSVLPMSAAFHIILGWDWLKQAKCNMHYVSDCLTRTDHAGRSHTTVSREHDANFICLIVSAMHLEEGLQDHDMLYTVHIDRCFCTGVCSTIQGRQCSSEPLCVTLNMQEVMRSTQTYERTTEMQCKL